MTAVRPAGSRGEWAPARPAVVAAGAEAGLLPSPPTADEKTSYVDRQLGYLTLVVMIGYGSIIISQGIMEVRYRTWVLAPWTAFTIIYLLVSLLSNFTGRDFDLGAHQARVGAWRPHRYPDVDVFLPVCGEPPELLRNTWTYVGELLRAYPGDAAAFVLDDKDDPGARELAGDFGFVYRVRDNRGWMKKAGNLRYAFERTRAEFYLILDADFAPRPDFLAETLPYFDDPAVGIVQTPQFFRPGPRHSWVERAAGPMQEVFYRSMQTSRDSFGAAVCVGSCAVYRRAAIQAAGGPALIAHAEDVHTGLDVISHGWSVKYIPVNLATGASPDTVDAFAHQQYRWCLGSTTPLRRLWKIPMPARARAAYLSGFLYYLFTALLLFVVPLIAIGMLTFIPHDIHLRDYFGLAPAVINGFVLYPVWHRSEFGPATWALEIVRSWSHALAIWDHFRGKVMAWQPTGTSVSPVRRLWAALIIWNSGTGIAWLGLAVFRTYQFRSEQFIVIFLFALFYIAPVAWTLWDRKARSR
jgi:cellulose synthase/poly-beta-1,6-N-acetylglucosamine synthase-like glycosyltransferase